MHRFDMFKVAKFVKDTKQGDHQQSRRHTNIKMCLK